MDEKWQAVFDLENQILPLQTALDARNAAGTEATAAADAAAAADAKREAFEAKEEAAALLQTQFDSATAEEKTAMTKDIAAAEREEEKYRREMEQQDEDRLRAEAAQARRETEDLMNEDLWAVESELDYFRTLIANNDAKLEFLDLVYQTFDDSEEGWMERDQIDQEIGRIYDQNWEFQMQFDEIDTHLSNLNFERFIQEQAWQQEEEAAFQEDATRAEEQKGDYEAELLELNTWVADFDTAVDGMDASALAAYFVA